MEIEGNLSNWDPSLSLKHPNGYKIESAVEECDRLELTIVSCLTDGGEVDLDIDVSVPVSRITDDEIKLETLPDYATIRIANANRIENPRVLTFDVHAVVSKSGERRPIDSSESASAPAPESSENSTRVYDACEECGEGVPADASYCPNCGDPV